MSFVHRSEPIPNLIREQPQAGQMGVIIVLAALKASVVIAFIFFCFVTYEFDDSSSLIFVAKKIAVFFCASTVEAPICGVA